jgi:hypothetical protein
MSKDNEGKLMILDVYRKKKLIVTPEEWVRQHLLRYLVEEKNYPAALISSEGGIKVNRLARRYDALIYDKSGKPLVLIECKAPSVKLNQAVFDQVIAYNHNLKAKYIIVTNGLKHYCCKHNIANKKFEFLGDIPLFEML